MIKDTLKNIQRYSINKQFEDFKAFLKEAVVTEFTKLKLPLKAIPLEYTTKTFDLSKFENHQKFIDIHYIVKGQEEIGLTPVKELEPNMEYDQENDYQLLDGTVNETIMLNKGEFLLLFPGEAHVTGGVKGEVTSDIKKYFLKFQFKK
jgi:YhcH/YjgK/YiaL family protein